MKTVDGLHETINDLTTQLEETKSICDLMKAKATALADLNKEVNVKLRFSEEEIRSNNLRINELESVKDAYVKSLYDAKVENENYAEQRGILEKKLRHEDRLAHMREMGDLRQQWLREQALGKHITDEYR